MRKQSIGDSIIFETENIIKETNNGDINHYKVTSKLNEFNRNGRTNDDGRATKITVQQLSSTDMQEEDESAKNQDFLQNNYAVEKKVILIPCTTTRIKLETFCLTFHITV